ncbi:MAG: surface-adhesin E family protein [Brevundimonas sp.]
MKQLAAGLILLALGAVPAAAEAWHPYTRSPNVVFMADVDSITVTGEITSIRVASAERTGDAGDYSHSVETFEFRCGAASTWRTAGIVEYGPDGAETGRYPEEGAGWEEIHPNTSPDYLERIVCDGARAQPPIWATVKDYVDAGRG